MADEKRFDMKVHVRDRESGDVVKVNPYQLKVSASGREYIRAGVRYYSNGEQIDKSQKPIIKVSEQEANYNEALAEIRDAAEKVASQKDLLNEDKRQLDEKMKAFELEKAQFAEAQASGQIETIKLVDKVEPVTTEVVPEDTIEVVTNKSGEHVIISDPEPAKEPVIENAKVPDNASNETGAPQSNY